MAETPPYSILYIEDNEANRQLVEFIIGRRDDLSVTFASDGLSGLKELEENPIDLLLLDLSLPDIDGYTVLSLVKGAPQTADLPVIVVSGTYPPQVPQGLGVQPDKYLTKPVQIASLYEAIDELLGL